MAAIEHEPNPTFRENGTHVVGEVQLHTDGLNSQGSEGSSLSSNDPPAAHEFDAILRRSSDGSSNSNSNISNATPSSEEDFEEKPAANKASLGKSYGALQQNETSGPRKTITMPIAYESAHKLEELKTGHSDGKSGLRRRKSIPIKLSKLDSKGRYRLTALDSELRELLKQSIENEMASRTGKRRSKFSDLVFTQQFSTFDRSNPANATSPFHGFFTLFWLAMALLILKVAAENWKKFGSIFGRNEVLSNMFHKDVVVLGLTDGVMCGATVMGLVLQRLILKGWLSWNGPGWILQHIWQSCYIAFFIWWTRHRGWSWTHTVFTVLHCITMLMKQHSYAFYNGYLSELYKRRAILESKLKQLDHLQPAKNPSTVNPAAEEVDNFYIDGTENPVSRRRFSIANTDKALLQEDTPIGGVASAIDAGAELDLEQITAYDRIIKWEIDELSVELQGKSTDGSNRYPKNLTLKNWAEWTVLPTLVYELEYPRQARINWYYVAEKTLATFGTIGVMIVISQAYIYPVVMHTVKMKEDGWTLEQRLYEFPWVLSDLLFPFMMEYMLSWYVIWECVLNLLAELTCFADRGFYADWWNTVSWDQFAKDWNRPVHAFLLRHVYHSSISALHISRGTATLITFLLSACVHELLMWTIFHKLRGYLLCLQMAQVPLMVLSRTRLLKGRAILGNVVFWLGIFTGPSFLCSLYLIL
ncbi:MAG: acyl-CoA/sterol acyltransferase [Vezdaea aestivalis]|nr:MAG: acyl-CoA/sterol acyltransferase [Vezdaea aestivalis]